MKIALLSLAVSLALAASPALAGWGTNGQYGNTPTSGGSSGGSTSTSTNTGGGYGGTGSMDTGSSGGGVWNNGGGNTGGGVWNGGESTDSGYGGGNGPVWNNGGGGYPKGGSSKKVYCLAADQIANMVQQRGYLMYSIDYSNGRFVVNVADQRNYPYILKFNCQGKLTSSTPVKMKTKKPYGGNGGNQGYGGNGGGQDWGGNGGNQNWGGGNQGYGGNGGGIQVWGGNGGGYGGSGPNW